MSSPTHYKLTYFPARAYAEPIRHMFHIANVPFEDVHVFRDDGSWDALKPDTPFGQVPVLEVDGFKIPQSYAIGRFIAKKFGFYGQTDEEAAMIDAVVDQFRDFFTEWVKFYIAERIEKKDGQELKKIRQEIAQPAVDSWFSILKRLLSGNSSGFLIGSKISWADLVVADGLTTLGKFGFCDFGSENYAEIEKFQLKINGTGGLKEWLEKRGDTDI